MARGGLRATKGGYPTFRTCYEARMLKSPDAMRAELYETGTMDQLERLHIQVQIEALESQKLAAAAIVKNSRYMLMSVVMATIATTITAAGLVFNIISLARVLR
jgi:hypothetical protein